MDISKEITEKVKRDKITIRHLSKVLDIPYDRIYKWVQGKGQPKNEDRIKVLSWLNEDSLLQKEIPLKEKSKTYDNLIAILVAEVAALKADKTGEPLQSIIMKLYKAAGDEDLVNFSKH